MAGEWRPRIRAAASVAAILVALAAGPGRGPTAAADSGDIVVTGTLIRGAVETGALPVTVLSQEDLLRKGQPSIPEIIQSLPAAAGSLGDTNQFDSRSQGSEGVSSVNLRGLGPSRFLVLMNGRRFAEAPHRHARR